MCNRHDAEHHWEHGKKEAPALTRRTFLAAGATALAALPFASTMGWAAPAAGIPAVGWGTSSATRPLSPVRFKRRDLRPDDILIDILYAGVCHSDIHTARGDWGPVDYMVVPGHEIVGRVAAVGTAVTKFKVGDHAGVGCMVSSCGTCTYCREGLEQYCVNTFTPTYGKARDGEVAYGGYSNNIVVRESFAITMPRNVDIRSVAPLLCAGITTFSPMQHWKVAAGDKVGVLGLGGPDMSR
jgi:uncharacterized zinc-type alcohol dehydrogenase-like protein